MSHKLTKHGAPFFFVQFCANAKGRDLIMAKMKDAGRGFASEHVGEVLSPKHLAGTVHAGQGFFGLKRAVPRFNLSMTGVAIATRFSKVFAEIGKQHLTTAFWGFTVAQYGLNTLLLNSFKLFIAACALNKLPHKNNIA